MVVRMVDGTVDGLKLKLRHHLAVYTRKVEGNEKRGPHIEVRIRRDRPARYAWDDTLTPKQNHEHAAMQEAKPYFKWQEIEPLCFGYGDGPRCDGFVFLFLTSTSPI